MYQQAQLPMTHRDYCLKGRDDRILHVYRAFALNALGADKSWARTNIDKMIDFETELANVSTLVQFKRLLKTLFCAVYTPDSGSTYT